jgi:kinetochore protein NDC80
MLNDVIKFKMHVQKNLEEYEFFVADELEKELGSDELKDDGREEE